LALSERRFARERAKSQFGQELDRLSGTPNAKETKMPKFLVATAVLIALATPALAAEYFVVKDPASGKCSIATEKPDGTKLVMIGTQAYPSKEEAKAAKKANAECKKKDA
jgi:hypothetical protein